VTLTVVTGHSMALSRRSRLYSTMSSLHDVLVHDIDNCNKISIVTSNLLLCVNFMNSLVR
jgi:hypothetical protein